MSDYLATTINLFKARGDANDAHVIAYLEHLRAKMCRCNPNWDIRCRCLPNREPKKFSVCPMRIHTALWLMQNEYEFCRNIESKITKKDKHKVVKRWAKKEYKFNDRDIAELIELYDEEQKEWEDEDD